MIQDHVPILPFRSCHSVPDLTAAEDPEVTKYTGGAAGEATPHAPQALQGHRSRPSSTGVAGLEVTGAH